MRSQEPKLLSRPCKECNLDTPIQQFIYQGQFRYSKCRKCRNKQRKLYVRKNIEKMRIYWKERDKIKQNKKNKKIEREANLYWTNLWHECGNDPRKFTKVFKEVGGFKSSHFE